jgi:hypothetical protein
VAPARGGCRIFDPRGTSRGSNEFHKVGRGGYVFDDLRGFWPDAEVAKIREFLGAGPRFAGVGDLERSLHHRGDVALGVVRECGEMTDFRNIFGPTGMRGVDWLERFAHGFVAGDVAIDFPRGVLVRGADEQIARPRAGVRERIGLVDHDVLKTAVAEGVAFFHGVEPADHALAAGAGAEFDLLQLNGERVRVVHLRDKGVGANFGVVGFGDAEGVDALHGYAGALEEFGRVGVGGGDVGREAVAFIEPVSLAKLANNGTSGVKLAQNQLADFADVGRCLLYTSPSPRD